MFEVRFNKVFKFEIINLMSNYNSSNPTKNGRIVYAWRTPAIHFFVLFCLYKQAQAIDRQWKDK